MKMTTQTRPHRAKERLSDLSGSVFTADRIVVLADGRVRELGDHDELLSAEGAYAEMFAAQAKYFNDDVEAR